MVGRSRIGLVDVQVSQRIRTARLAQGMTQQKLAELLGVTFQQVQKYEKGTNRVAMGRLHAIANALGVPMNYFIAEIAMDLTVVPSTTGVQSITAALKTKEGVRVAAALSRIQNANVRRHVADLLEAIIAGQGEEGRLAI
jgi:DNA-binding XRE family transcriptional regulator